MNIFAKQLRGNVIQRLFSTRQETQAVKYLITLEYAAGVFRVSKITKNHTAFICAEFAANGVLALKTAATAC